MYCRDEIVIIVAFCSQGQDTKQRSRLRPCDVRPYLRLKRQRSQRRRNNGHLPSKGQDEAYCWSWLALEGKGHRNNLTTEDKSQNPVFILFIRVHLFPHGHRWNKEDDTSFFPAGLTRNQYKLRTRM